TSHRIPFVPASEAKPPKMGTSIPIIDRMPQGFTDLNEMEDDKAFSSNLYTDTAVYGNWVSNAKRSSSKNNGSFYEQNLRYDLYATKKTGDSLAFSMDTTTTNDPREYKEGFTLNQFAVESRTPKSMLVFGHSYPEFSDYTVTQQVMGLYGVQRFEDTEIRSFAGYKAVEKDDLKNPRRVGGVRMEHRHDEAVTIGLNAVSTKDVRDNPGSDKDLPTLQNRVYSMDVQIKPTENLYVNGEYAGSNTDFDMRDEFGHQSGSAFRAMGGYSRENFQFEAGVEEGGSAFLTPLSESLRDERAFLTKFFYELNRYISARLAWRGSRDNLGDFKRATLVRDQPEAQITMHPSDYYRDLRFDLYYQPLHEYSDNGKYLDRYRTLGWLELNHRAGSFHYFAGLTSTIDKDKITPLNDRDIGKLDFKLTWDFDAFRQVYSSYSTEQLSYRNAGGGDRTSITGFGGRSRFHEDLSLALDYIYEANDLKTALSDSRHYRLNFSLTKEFNNLSRFIFDVEGSDNRFDAKARDFSDVTAKLRFIKSF
ncbi:hypothetical protein HYY75_04550, partial [bacterium]|nr:hypothetical protein [bacterium]